MNDRQRIARAALFSFKEAVLEVLYEARSEGRLQPQEISKRLGIRKSESADHPYGFVRSVLFLLNDEKHNDKKYVDYVINEGWKITQEGVLLLGTVSSE